VSVHHGKMALISGITGQDGSCLAELLLDNGYVVHGLGRARAAARRSSRARSRARSGASSTPCRTNLEGRVQLDPRYLRPTEVDVLRGDASKASAVLGWRPKVEIASLVEMMVEADLELADRERHSMARSVAPFGAPPGRAR
jgi:GDP-D-mannose dehydratase